MEIFSESSFLLGSKRNNLFSFLTNLFVNKVKWNTDFRNSIQANLDDIYTQGAAKWSDTFFGPTKAKPSKEREMCLHPRNLHRIPFCYISFSVAKTNWMSEHRAFIVETFIKNNEWVTTTQRGLSCPITWFETIGFFYCADTWNQRYTLMTLDLLNN